MDSDTENDYVCDICKKSFESRHEYHKHINSTKKCGYVCKYCNDYYKKLKDYQSHTCFIQYAGILQLLPEEIIKQLSKVDDVIEHMYIKKHTQLNLGKNKIMKKFTYKNSNLKSGSPYYITSYIHKIGKDIYRMPIKHYDTKIGKLDKKIKKIQMNNDEEKFEYYNSMYLSWIRIRGRQDVKIELFIPNTVDSVIFHNCRCDITILGHVPRCLHFISSNINIKIPEENQVIKKIISSGGSNIEINANILLYKTPLGVFGENMHVKDGKKIYVISSSDTSGILTDEHTYGYKGNNDVYIFDKENTPR